jgi:tRNA(Ile)-lysidine synthase
MAAPEAATPAAWPSIVVEALGRCTFPPPGTPAACAVSGGADSLALLVLAVAGGLRVTAVHVDHGLRPESHREAALVEEAARRLGTGFASERVHVAPGPNLEARARVARYAALPPGVLTGHTADDQAETVLLNLLRGAGLDGLAGMRPVGHPLLLLRRRDTRAVCAAVGLVPFDDPSNTSREHRRNRVRHEVMPLLDDVAGRDVAEVVARQARLLRDDADLLDALAADVDPTDARALAAAPPPLARRAIRRWLADPYPPAGATVDRVLAVARGDAVACELPGGRRVERHARRLSVSP